MGDGGARPGALEPGEDALRAGEESFALLISSVADYAIFLLRPDGTVASWNLGAERLKGYRPDEIIGRHLSTFYTPEDREAHVPDRGLAEALEQGRWRSEGWRVRKDGTRFWADVVITALRGSDGAHRGFAKVTRDLTERKRNEDALREIAERERDTAERLRELDRLKTDFMAVVAHDLRSPVGVARSLLDIATDEWASTSDADRLDLVRRARDRMASLAAFVEDVFDAARIETGELQVTLEDVDVVGLVERIVADARVASPDRTFDVDAPDEAAAAADPQRSWQVLVNLVSNAAKFSPPGGTVSVVIRSTADHVVVGVSDDGPGIPPAERELLFRRFGRLPAAATTPGVGLGLYIARSLAQAQGGTLEVADPVGGIGAHFVLTLPIGSAS